MRGAVLVRSDDWRDLSLLRRRRLTITVTGISEDETETGLELTRVLREVGLAASVSNHCKVTVRVLWKWHVPEPVSA
ncbi:hypothetical protein ACFOX2_09855 [Corynebacterium marambiense]|uniref:hypothetical protein n=1 Tax=Corynebacterium marambiense TaxID=2765364 RepID=UPI00361E49F1